MCFSTLISNKNTILFINQRLTVRPRGLTFELNLAFIYYFITLLRRLKIISFMQIQYTVGFLLDVALDRYHCQPVFANGGGGGVGGWVGGGRYQKQLALWLLELRRL
jgi:hypothetical protein